MEKYGTIPKRFTKKWWEYFWEYYKVHVIVGVLLAFMAGVTVYQLATKINYDLIVTYIGEVAYDEDAPKNIADAMSEHVPDITGNGKTEVQLQVLAAAVSNSVLENPQYTMGLETKKTFEIQIGESYLFIVDENQARSIYENGLADGTFIKADDWIGEENKTSERAQDGAGEFFVKISDKSFFEEKGFEAENIYIGVIECREDKDAETEKKAAIDLANYLLGYKA